MLEYIIDYLQHIEAYMDRPSLEYLNILQKKHIEKIPHENIDGIYKYCSICSFRYGIP
jgi:arylamine N-acetyltransferase